MSNHTCFYINNLTEHYTYLGIATSEIIKEPLNGSLFPSCSVELSVIARVERERKLHFLSQVEIDFHSVQAMDPGKKNSWAV